MRKNYKHFYDILWTIFAQHPYGASDAIQVQRKNMRDILRVLAVNREYAQYNMPSAIGKDYRTILRHLQQLEKSGAIKLARTEQAKKRER